MVGMVIQATDMEDTMAVGIMAVAIIVLPIDQTGRIDPTDQDQSILSIDRTDRRHYRQDLQQDQVPDPLEICVLWEDLQVCV